MFSKGAIIGKLERSKVSMALSALPEATTEPATRT